MRAKKISTSQPDNIRICGGTMNDLYLKPGAPCEVWDDSREAFALLLYFNYEESGNLRFVNIPNKVGKPGGYIFHNYRPIGTEWGYAPKWAGYSTVDADGSIIFWDFADIIKPINGSWSWDQEDFKGQIPRWDCGGICPDKSRYEGENWKDSLRMRPEWARE